MRLCLMTSVATDEDSKAYFAANNNFGISNENIIFFMQGYLPAIDINGKILLQSKHSISLAPNGTGGVYEALYSSGLLNTLDSLNTKSLHVTYHYSSLKEEKLP